MSRSDLAEENVQQLNMEGYHVYWKEIGSSGQNCYAVYTGPYKDLLTARN